MPTAEKVLISTLWRHLANKTTKTKTQMFNPHSQSQDKVTKTLSSAWETGTKTKSTTP